jgi:hypothetical protein
MLTKQAEIDEARSHYVTETKRLAELDEHFTKVDEEAARVTAEEKAIDDILAFHQNALDVRLHSHSHSHRCCC